MPIQAQVLQLGPWTAGVIYALPGEDLPVNALHSMQNCRIGNAGQLEKRSGFSKYISTALSGAPTLTMAFQQQFSASSTSTWVCAGAKVWEDVAGTWTDRTAALTITAGNDNTFSVVNANGTMCFTNGVNPPLKAAAAAGNATLLDVDSRFTWSKWVEYFDTRIWHGNNSVSTSTVYRSEAGDIETIGAASFYTVDGAVTGLKAFRAGLSIHSENGIWMLYPTGNATVPYSRQPVASRGTVSGRALVVTPEGEMLFVRKDGIYTWRGVDEPRKIEVQIALPALNGELLSLFPLEGVRYWDNINTSRLHQSHAVVYPAKEEVWFFLPYGSSQATMNHVMIFNYRRRIFYGPYLNFTRNCSALIDGAPHAGGYSDGLLYQHEDTDADNGAAIDGWGKTSATPPLGAAATVRWLYGRHHYDLEGDHQLQISQSGPGLTSSSSSISMGGGYDAIPNFVVGLSAIAPDGSLLSQEADLQGYSNAIQLTYRNSNASEPFTMRRSELMYQPIGLEREED
jgi:hypothetical protein